MINTTLNGAQKEIDTILNGAHKEIDIILNGAHKETYTYGKEAFFSFPGLEKVAYIAVPLISIIGFQKLRQYKINKIFLKADAALKKANNASLFEIDETYKKACNEADAALKKARNEAFTEADAALLEIDKTYKKACNEALKKARNEAFQTRETALKKIDRTRETALLEIDKTYRKACNEADASLKKALKKARNEADAALGCGFSAFLSIHILFCTAVGGLFFAGCSLENKKIVEIAFKGASYGVLGSIGLSVGLGFNKYKSWKNADLVCIDV